MKRDLDQHAAEILERGYTILERTHADAVVAEFRAKLEGLYRAHGAPGAYSKSSRPLTSEIEISPTGFVVFKLLKLFPELAPRLLSIDTVEVARRVLGPDMHLELSGAVLSDESRPFFGWHSHIGGIDAEGYRALPSWPRFERSERVIAVLYLDDVDEASGEILTLPRRLGDPTEPPFDTLSGSWQGQARLRFRRGSTLIFEQANWHAVEPKRTPGLRMFVGCYFTSQLAPPTQARDDSLEPCRGSSELLASVLQK